MTSTLRAHSVLVGEHPAGEKAGYLDLKDGLVSRLPDDDDVRRRARRASSSSGSTGTLAMPPQQNYAMATVGEAADLRQEA